VVHEADADEVICRGVEGRNLVALALQALRTRGWDGTRLRVEIEKRIPVAAGLGGGSADAAAVLRMVRGEVEGIEELAAELGADVPSQLEPRFALVGGAGEVVETLPAPGEYGLVLIPDPDGLATAEVYERADRMGLGRDRDELEDLRDRLREAARSGASPLEYPDLLVNDLQEAALELRPGLGEAIRALDASGAARAMVTGSGPTAFGLFPDIARADRAAASLPPRYAGAIVTAPYAYR
jgi:4-diphosphocytidyl-2-C-methyl-D-erythritol kinase